MKFKEGGAEKWDLGMENNKDIYGRGIYRYAETWANMVETELARGKAIGDVFEKTSKDADAEGITGYMYGAAVSVLYHVWAYGEELRKWHNKEYNHEGDGVVNPAIVSIETKPEQP